MRDLLHWIHINPTVRHNFTVSLEFVPQDLWVGIFWRQRPNFPMLRWARLDIWFCVVPTLPIHLVYYRRPNEQAKKGAA